MWGNCYSGLVPLWRPLKEKWFFGRGVCRAFAEAVIPEKLNHIQIAVSGHFPVTEVNILRKRL